MYIANAVLGSLSLLCFLSTLACSQSSPPIQKIEKKAAIKTTEEKRIEPVKDSSSITIDFLLGKFDYTKNPDFVKVPGKMSSKEIYLQKEVLKAFSLMRDSALKDGISLTIISGTRNFWEQKVIWERKWEIASKSLKDPVDIALKILTYSSMPSTSRHHWGTDIDINSLEPKYFLSGKGLKEYQWLSKNAPIFGFYQVYTSQKNGRKGYYEEAWHWSFLPLATIYLKEYNQRITSTDITGFTGSDTNATIDVISNYVNGIESYTLPSDQK